MKVAINLEAKKQRISILLCDFKNLKNSNKQCEAAIWAILLDPPVIKASKGT